jgi:hypothetical protein
MSFTTPRYIDTGARGAVLPYYAHIYTAGVRTPDPPTTYGSQILNLLKRHFQNSKIRGAHYQP